MAACTCGAGPAGGSNSLPDGSVHKGRSTRQLHDVTGKVQPARLIIAAQVREVRVAVLDAHLNLIKRINSEQEKQTSLSGGHGFPGAGVKYPLFWAQDIPLVRGMG